LAPRVRRHSWGEAQLGRTSRNGTGGGAYGADSQRGGVCATEGVDGGRCRRSTGLGRSENRNSRVDRSWRCECHYYSHHFFITASHRGTGARSLLRILAITRTVTAQEAQLRTGLTASPSMFCRVTNTVRACLFSETALPRRQLPCTRHLTAGCRPSRSPPPPYGRRPRPCPRPPPLGAPRAAGAAPAAGRLLSVWRLPSRCRRPRR